MNLINLSIIGFGKVLLIIVIVDDEVLLNFEPFILESLIHIKFYFNNLLQLECFEKIFVLLFEAGLKDKI